MTSSEIKQFIIDNFFKDCTGQVSNKKKWLREQKIKFNNYSEFDDKYGNMTMEDIIDDYDPIVKYGTPPFDNTPHVFRVFMNYGTEDGDFQIHVFTDATDSKIVYIAGSAD